MTKDVQLAKIYIYTYIWILLTVPLGQRLRIIKCLHFIGNNKILTL